MTFAAALGTSSTRMARPIARNSRFLASITRVELAKRHAGSVLGSLDRHGRAASRHVFREPVHLPFDVRIAHRLPYRHGAGTAAHDALSESGLLHDAGVPRDPAVR